MGVIHLSWTPLSHRGVTHLIFLEAWKPMRTCMRHILFFRVQLNLLDYTSSNMAQPTRRNSLNPAFHRRNARGGEQPFSSTFDDPPTWRTRPGRRGGSCSWNDPCCSWSWTSPRGASRRSFCFRRGTVEPTCGDGEWFGGRVVLYGVKERSKVRLVDFGRWNGKGVAQCNQVRVEWQRKVPPLRPFVCSTPSACGQCRPVPGFAPRVLRLWRATLRPLPKELGKGTLDGWAPVENTKDMLAPVEKRSGWLEIGKQRCIAFFVPQLEVERLEYIEYINTHCICFIIVIMGCISSASQQRALSPVTCFSMRVMDDPHMPLASSQIGMSCSRFSTLPKTHMDP